MANLILATWLGRGGAAAPLVELASRAAGCVYDADGSLQVVTTGGRACIVEARPDARHADCRLGPSGGEHGPAARLRLSATGDSVAGRQDGGTQRWTSFDREPCHLVTTSTCCRDGVQVVMEGYLARDDYGAAGDAAIVAEQYQRGGVAAVERLDGSFRIFLLDEASDAVHVWTDRVGSMPSFAARVGEVLLIVPSTRCLRGIDGVDRRLVPGSLASMALNGALLDEHTYWQGVQLLGPARHVEIRDGRVQLRRYWQRSFAPGEVAAPSVEQVVDTITRATRRHVKRFSRPRLALSGGLDSRVLLGACRRAGLAVPTVSWGVERVGDPQADLQVGRRAAEAFGIEHLARQMDLDQLGEHAGCVVDLTGGLCGHLGNYPEGRGPGRQLAGWSDALLFGNEMFGVRSLVRSRQEALDEIGIATGRRLLLLRFLLQPDVAHGVLADYRTQCEGLLESVDPAAPPSDVKDILYWRNRFPRVIASQAELYRADLHYISPLLDGEVLDLARHLTAQQRSHKQYLSECVKRGFAEEFAVPVSRYSSRADWPRRFARRGPVQRFIVQALLEPCSVFDEWFDPGRVRAWLGWALAEGADAPWQDGIGVLRRWGLWGAGLAMRPTFRESIVLNLVTLKLWMGSGSTTAVRSQS